MKIIGHRGARGIELENSVASIRSAMELNIDAIEFDIHRTRDNVLVVIHDPTTKRVADQNKRIRDITYKELQSIRLNNGQQIPTLAEALAIADSRAVYIDIKDAGTAEPLVSLLQSYPDANVTFVSAIAAELQRLRELQPQAATYIYFLKAKQLVPRPIKMVQTATSINATGIGIDKLLLNPLTYYLARRRGLQLYCYSIGSTFLARVLLFIYPRMDLCTSRPDLLAKYSSRSQVLS